MNNLHSTRMKLQPKYGGPGEATPFRITFADTAAKLKAFLISRGDTGGLRKSRSARLASPLPQTSPAVAHRKTDYRAALRLLVAKKNLALPLAPGAARPNTSQECVKPRQRYGGSDRPSRSDIGTAAPMAA